MTPRHDRAWYERRLTGWGASEAASLLGISRWKSPRAAVEEKARRIIPDPETPERLRLRVGGEMEPLLARHLVEVAIERGIIETTDDGWPIHGFRRSSTLYRSKTHPFVIANADGFVGRDSDLAELKTDAFGYEPWGEQDGDPARVVPPAYYAQLQHGMAATGRQRALLFVLIGLGERRLYVVPRDDDYIADLIDVEEPLWRAVEEARRRLDADPDADIEDLLPAYTAVDAAAVRKRHPVDDGLILPATAEQEQLIGRLRAAAIDVALAEKRYDAIETLVIDAIGEAAGLSSTVGTVTYKRSADSVSVDWMRVATIWRDVIESVDGSDSVIARDSVGRALEKAGIEELDGVDLDEQLDYVIGQFVTTKAGSRRIYAPRSWKKMAGMVAGAEEGKVEGNGRTTTDAIADANA